MRSTASATMLAIETLGLLTVLYLWLPLYRRLQAGPAGDHPGTGIAWYVLAAAVIMQVCYWGRRRLPESANPREGVALGHALLFVSRLAFVFVGSTFSLFVMRVKDTRFAPVGFAAAVVTLFAIFCYVLDLERLARPRLERTRHA